jgi:hypothetical protein
MKPIGAARFVLPVLAVASCAHMPPSPDMRAAVTPPLLNARTSGPVTVPFVLDNNMIFVDVAFVKSDGSERKVLAAVNMGQTPLYLSNELFRELAPERNHPLRYRIGNAVIDEDGSTVQPESMLAELSATTLIPAEEAKKPSDRLATQFAPRKVDAIIPAGVLVHFEVVWDYRAKTLTLAAPGSLKPEGVAVPVRVNPATGLVNVDVTFDGASHPFVIDNGGTYSGFRDAKPWIRAHPAWLRSIGGIGAANYSMSAADADLPVVKITDPAIGPLQLDELGGVEVIFPRLIGPIFWNWYSGKAGESTDGWIGGNILKNYRLTIDAQNRMSYWLAEQPADANDLDQVGVVLQRSKAAITIAGIARKNGLATVSEANKGDTLLAIADLNAATATDGQLLGALHGKPGDVKRLTLERQGTRLEVDTTVTHF